MSPSSPPTPEQDPARFPPYAQAAGLIVLVGGLFVAATGGQVLLLTRVPGAWIAVPVALVAFGLAAVPVGGAMSNAKPRAAVAGGALTALNAALSLAWGLFAASHGLVALLPFVSAVFSALGAITSALVIVPYQRFDTARQKLFSPEPGGEAPPSTPLPWPQIIAGGFAVLLGAAFYGALHAPAEADRIIVQAKMLAHLRRPSAAADLAPATSDYGYTTSPFLEYLDYEAHFVDFDAERAAAFADRIAEVVGWRLLLETGEDDVDAAERALWAAGEARKVPLWIAAELRNRGAFYYPESLLSRSFDPDLHEGEGSLHLDCDQLTYLFTHVAWRLDLDMRPVQSPFHMYLSWSPPDGVTGEPLTVETTNFRRVDILGNRVDFMGEGIGEDFFIDADHHSSGKSGTWAAPELVEAAGLYQPATERDISDAIVANVLVGLEGRVDRARLRAEAEARLEGTRSYVLVSNLYSWTLIDAKGALLDQDPARAMDDARSAERLRLAHPGLLLAPDPDEERVLAASSALLEPAVADTPP